MPKYLIEQEFLEVGKLSAEGDFAEILWGASRNGSADSVGRKLCH